MIGPEALALTQAQVVMRSWDRPGTGDWANVLATFPFFSGVGKRRLRKLLRRATFAEFAAGETIPARGGSTDSLYVILGGAAKTLHPGGRALGIGDYFGGPGPVEGTPPPTTVVATQELHLMRVPLQSFPDLRLAHSADQDSRSYGSERDLAWSSE